MQKCTISSSSLVCSHYKFINALSLLTTAFSHSSIDKLYVPSLLLAKIGRNYVPTSYTITKLSIILPPSRLTFLDCCCCKIVVMGTPAVIIWKFLLFMTFQPFKCNLRWTVFLGRCTSNHSGHIRFKWSHTMIGICFRNGSSLFFHTLKSCLEL